MSLLLSAKSVNKIHKSQGILGCAYANFASKFGTIRLVLSA